MYCVVGGNLILHFSISLKSYEDMGRGGEGRVRSGRGCYPSPPPKS